MPLVDLSMFQKVKKKDHSCTDRKFAWNNQLKFYTPETFFLNWEETTNFSWGFSPLEYLKSIENQKSTALDDIVSKETEMIIIVGAPSSGKSSFSKKYLIPNGYVHVNQDLMKTPAKCHQAANEALENKKSVVIDNTNPMMKKREEYINIAKEHKISCRCFYFKNPKELSKHMNFVRVRFLKGGKALPDVVYAKYFKSLEEPTIEEGFTEVREINFIPDFTDKDLETIFKQYSDK